MAGRYELFPGRTLTFRPEGTTLVCEIWNQTTMTLAPESDSLTGASVDNERSMIWAKRLP